MDTKDSKLQLDKMDSKDDLNKTWKEMTCREKYSHIWKNVTVEPMLAFYIMVSYRQVFCKSCASSLLMMTFMVTFSAFSASRIGHSKLESGKSV